ncbi:MAG: response regulator [Desulfobacteraceae bacterium]|nr:MAG: response regulator [Desulfobacteraceae bacterium]
MKRILVVNNDESMRMLYSDELMEEGYEVIATCMGPRAISLIRETRPDIVLLVIGCSQEEGLDLLMDIRDVWDHLPVLVCTDTLPLHGRMRSVAADFFMVKCSSLKDLKLRIEMILGSGDRLQSSSARGKRPREEAVCMSQMDLYCLGRGYEQ